MFNEHSHLPEDSITKMNWITLSELEINNFTPNVGQHIYELNLICRNSEIWLCVLYLFYRGIIKY